eukprot:g26897.t1
MALLHWPSQAPMEPTGSPGAPQLGQAAFRAGVSAAASPGGNRRKHDERRCFLSPEMSRHPEECVTPLRDHKNRCCERRNRFPDRPEVLISPKWP